MIVSIIGVETYYGRIAGSYRVIDALSTLAFDYPRRSEFFTKELKHFLILTRDQGMDPLLLKGSYAGAMGYGQFMPSSYRSYAIDFDGDEKADIWNNPVDAIGSVANYFKAHGWTEGDPVIVAANATAI
jgi:membrane-bound lytic murein transglycosylase B